MTLDKSLVSKGVVQFGKTAKDYATHRPGFPPSFFQKLVKKKYVAPHHRTLDIGTGTGTIARGFAQIGCSSIGLDPAEELMAEGKKMAERQNLKVHWVKGCAESLPFPDRNFNVVAAAQCWHWFDPQIASKEIARVLTSDGKLIICNFDFQPKDQNVVARTLDLIPQFNPEWTPEAKPGFFRPEPDRIATPPGFKLVELDNYIEDAEFTHASWRGRIRASAAIGASNLAQTKIEAFDKALQEMLTQSEPIEPMKIPHFVTTRVYECLT